MAEAKILVVGAGIVGLCVAYAALRDGAQVTIVDRDPSGDKASFGNAAGIAVTEVMPAAVPGLWKKVPLWIADPLGPLALRAGHVPKLLPWLWRFAAASRPAEVERLAAALAAILAPVYDDFLPLLATIGLSADLTQKGALTVYESADGPRRDRQEWELKRAHGIVVEEISGAEARAMEPALGPIVQAGMFTPQWSHIADPKRLVDRLREWLVGQGAVIVAGEAIGIRPLSVGAELALADGRKLVADRLVVAAGAWSARLVRPLGDRVSLESERGYNTTIADPGVSLSREVIFADRKFVATPLSIGLRIGGAAEFGGLDAAPNFARSKALAKLAKLYLPGLAAERGREWAGHRPTTPDTLPVIGRSAASPDILHAFGHGHLGLTLAPTTGRLLGDLLLGNTPAIDLAPFSARRFG